MTDTNALAKVIRHPSNMRYKKESPDAVYNFRETIKQFKESVFNALEENTTDKQNPIHYKHAIDRIFQLGTLLRRILNDSDDDSSFDSDTQKSLQVVRDLFKEKQIEFDQLSDEEKDMCLYYVKIDIFMFPSVVDRAHTDFLVKDRK